LLAYGVRWYGPALGRFISPDTIVPDYANPQSLNRYSYVYNNPLKYVDPTGHNGECPLHAEPYCSAWKANNVTSDNLWPTKYSGLTFDQLSPRDQQVILDAGVTPETWNVENFGANGRDLSMTAEDPVVWFSFGIVGGAKYGPKIVAAGKEAILYVSALCTWNPVCARVFLGYDPSSSRVVYRGLREGEDPMTGLKARSPGAGNSPVSHIAGKTDSQWISTSTDPSVAFQKYGEHGVVAIDLAKVDTLIVDYSQGIPGMPGMLSNWAAKDSEVLIMDEVLTDAILWWFR
jgi:hypothetical protein